jgi:hypothetical protein
MVEMQNTLHPQAHVSVKSTLFSTSVLIFFVSGILLFQISLSSPSQQYSMRDLFTVFVCSLAFGYVQHRIRKSNYTRAKEIERQKGLVEAKEAESNRLLLNILPETIANELKASGSTKPIRIEAATVMFHRLRWLYPHLRKANARSRSR